MKVKMVLPNTKNNQSINDTDIHNYGSGCY